MRRPLAFSLQHQNIKLYSEILEKSLGQNVIIFNGGK
jgi:hypothetical protein